jgi:hypothetical protein
MLDLCSTSVVRSEAKKKTRGNRFLPDRFYIVTKIGWPEGNFLVWKGFDILGAVERNRCFFLYEEIDVFLVKWN